MCVSLEMSCVRAVCLEKRHDCIGECCLAKEPVLEIYVGVQSGTSHSAQTEIRSQGLA